MRASTPAAASTRRPTGVLGMTPADFRAGGDGATIRFAVGECSLGCDPRRRTASGASARSCSASDPDQPGARAAGPVPEGPADRRATPRSRLRGQGHRLRRGARRSGSTCRSTSAAPPSSSASGRRCGDPARRDRELCRDRRAHRRAEGGAGRGAGLRIERTSPSRSPAIAWCGPTVRCRATAGASSASAPCSAREAQHVSLIPDGGRPYARRSTGRGGGRPRRARVRCRAVACWSRAHVPTWRRSTRAKAVPQPGR